MNLYDKAIQMLQIGRNIPKILILCVMCTEVDFYGSIRTTVGFTASVYINTEIRSGLKGPSQPSCRVPTYLVYFFQIHPRWIFFTNIFFI